MGNGVNFNGNITLGIKQAGTLIIILLSAGIWLGINVHSTKEKVDKMEVEIKQINENFNKMAIKVAVIANNLPKD